MFLELFVCSKYEGDIQSDQQMGYGDAFYTCGDEPKRSPRRNYDVEKQELFKGIIVFPGQYPLKTNQQILETELEGRIQKTW
jgi:hypothetical protein